MRALMFASATALLALSVPAAASADDDDDRRWRGSGVSQGQAIQIARSYGVWRISEIDRDDGGWEIEGRDRYGREIELDINRRGRVTSVDRDDDDDDDDRRRYARYDRDDD